MTWRLPLYARFLIWFGLNLLLLAAIIGLLLRTEFRIESVLSSLAADRVQPVADVILGELKTRPRSEWNAVLGRFEEAYGIQFSLLDDRNQLVAGAPLTLPESVLRRLPGPGPRGGPDGPPPDFGQGVDSNRRPVGRRLGVGPPAVFFRSQDPSGYWAVVRAPLEGPERGERGRPSFGRLVVFSESLSGGGLFIDFTPWWSAGGAVLLVSALWWIPFIGSISRSIRQMTLATERIAEGRFDVHVDERRTDELGRLGGAINRMTQRLSNFVTGQKRFLGDAAHELCSPLARMEMGLGILEERVPPSERERLEDVREEVRHMSGLVNELLQFSKAGLHPVGSAVESLDLVPLIQRVVDREGPAPHGCLLDLPSSLRVEAHPELLAKAIGNLVRNAVRYAGSEGPIRITAAAQGSSTLVQVSDAGPGVPSGDLPRLGEPFFRPDTARSAETGGTGLGLAIVRTAVAACGGTVGFENLQPRGFRATLTLKPAQSGEVSPNVP
jgi:two-component system sensor histidine kinase CpxA